MLKSTFKIFVETDVGEIIEAFTWCRSKESGIERARKDAKEFGVKPARIWAEPIQNCQ